MDYTMAERGRRITAACMQERSSDPAEIFGHIAGMDFVRMHGPEHHVLDGACLLTAFFNAGGDIDIETALKKLLSEGLRMPGAVCGLWGVCGAVMSIGAALAIIDGTGPLSEDDSWGSHMLYTSSALGELSKLGGPRCCKRDAYTAMQTASAYIFDRYGIRLQTHKVVCGFYPRNAQCIGERCPYHP